MLPGYLHFVHAAALKMFGKDMVSLRYPLALVSIIQAILIYRLFGQAGMAYAFTAGLLSVSLGVLQFLNPNQHWYCLFFTVILIFYLHRVPVDQKRVFLTAGFLVAVIYLFRQLTGVLVGFGTLSFFFYANRGRVRVPRGFLANGFAYLLAALLFYYVSQRADWFGWLVAIWPLLVLLKLATTLKISDSKAAEIIGFFLRGIAIGFLPLVVYHGYHQSLAVWIDDTFVRMLMYGEQPYLKLIYYKDLLADAWHILVSSASAVAKINAFYWLFLFVVLIGAQVIAAYQILGRANQEQKSIVLSFLALFYTVVALHFQTLNYLIQVIPLSALVVFNFMLRHKRSASPALLISLWLIVMAIGFHAAQPLTRESQGALAGRTIPMVPTTGIPYANFWSDPWLSGIYKKVIEVIHSETELEDAIFAVPYNPEMYFLSDRPNTATFMIFGRGIRSQEELEGFLKKFWAQPPKLIIDCPADKRHTGLSRQFIGRVKARYDLIYQNEMFEIFRLK